MIVKLLVGKLKIQLELSNFPLAEKSENKMQNPNEDTEWNDVLRAKGILPAKPKEAEVTEEDLIAMVEKTIKQKSGKKDLDEMDLDELDELEDEEEEKIMLQMRMQRMAEMKALSEKSK